MAEFNLQPIRDKMMEDLKGLEKTCENCEWELEGTEGTHCRHCIHNAEENFKPKEIHATEQEIRNKAIDEFISRLEKHEQENWVDYQEYGITWSDIELVAEQMKEV